MLDPVPPHAPDVARVEVVEHHDLLLVGELPVEDLMTRLPEYLGEQRREGATLASKQGRVPVVRDEFAAKVEGRWAWPSRATQ